MQDFLHITPELIESFLEARQVEGLTPSTLSSYKRALGRLYAQLPEDKNLRPDMLREMTEKQRAAGYAARTINVFLAAAEGLIRYAGLLAPQQARQEPEAMETPETSRAEYLQLLMAAKQQDKPRTYYLIKCFAVLGINIRDVHRLTAEAVKEGTFESSEGTVRIPEPLRRELERYAQSQGIVTGPLFRARDGKPIRRTGINEAIAAVGRRTEIPPERYSPKALRKLYERTQTGLQERVRTLLELEYERLLVEEDLTTGW